MKRVLCIITLLLSAILSGAENKKHIQQATDRSKGVGGNVSVASKPKHSCPRSGALPGSERGLVDEFQQIIRLLNKKLPDWKIANRLDNRRQKLLSAFVTSLGLSLRYSPKQYQTPAVNSKFKPLPLVWLKHNQIVYLRVDAFNPDVVLQFRQIHDILATNYRLVGMIIDLRNCRSFDYLNMVKCLKQLNITKTQKTLRKISIAMLMGNHTLGAAEYFINRSRITINPLTIGMSTAGQPFNYQAEKLATGGYLLLPIIPKIVGNQAIFTAQLPTVKLINNSQSNYSLQSKQPDVAVKYASNLLISLNAISGPFTDKSLIPK